LPTSLQVVGMQTEPLARVALTIEAVLGA